jgi:hypothetical protein
MKLADIEVDELVRELGIERSAWIKVAREEKRQLTDSERTTVCLLAALEHVFTKFAGR